MTLLPTYEYAHAACGATDRTWDAGAGTNRWNTNNNWNANNQPNTNAENAIIVAATRPTQVRNNPTIGCLEVQSGQLRTRNNETLTIQGDYFRNLNIDGIFWNTNHGNFWIVMDGSGPQTFENVDPLQNLRISNASSTVTLTNPFSISNNFDLTGTSTTIYIDADLNMSGVANAVTIPAGVTVNLRSGATWTVGNTLTVNGSLILDSGTTVIMENGTTLAVSSSGNLQLNGAAGSVAKVVSDGAGNSFTFTMAGLMSASYFRIDRMTTAGLNITGTVTSMSDGEFHNVANAGYAITLGATSSMPVSMSGLSFFDDDAHGNAKNIDATNYTGSTITLNLWNGGIGGTSFETDPSTKLTWGAQAGVELVLSDNTPGGVPATTIIQSSGDEHFATFSFSLNQASTMTNITEVTLTMSGTATSADVDSVKLYKDDGAGTKCVYDDGVDTQIDTTKSLTGSPPEATFTITSGDVQTDSDSNPGCIHVIAGTTSSAQDAKTIQFEISSSGDVTNSEAYSFSPTSGPPVAAGLSTIIGDPSRNWQGDADDRWTRNGNWQGGLPDIDEDCRVGSGTNIARLDRILPTTPTTDCQNAAFLTGGTIDYDGANERMIQIYGSLTIESGFTFQNLGHASDRIEMVGSSNQSLSVGTAFPGDLNIINTGTAPNDKVTASSDGTINGDLIIEDGTFVIASGVTFNVDGSVTIQSGATLEVEPGATLALGNAQVLTVDAGGVLKTVGTSDLKSSISGQSSSFYSMSVSGEIQAQYYTFSGLTGNGVEILTGATINATYYMQDGTFSNAENNSTDMLHLHIRVPGDALANMVFSTGGGAAAPTNVDTADVGTTATLTISNYSGDIAGLTYDNDPGTYAVAWSGATNTIEITQEATGPTNVDAGGSYNMGRFGFQQTLAGASYTDADVTELIVQMTGTGSASDVDQVRIYRDTDCDSAAGVLIGSGTFSGFPARKTFAIAAADLTIAADVASPPLNCIYVEYDVANAAGDGKTIGVSIASAGDITNDQTYAPSGSVSFPVDLGSAATIAGATNTTWTGASDTDWFTPGNWTSGVPSSTVNCSIDNVGSPPTIGVGTAACKNVSIGTGILTFAGASSQLDVYGAYTSTGTVTQGSGIIRMIDGGTGASQNISSSSTITNLEIEKTGGGTVTQTSSTMTVNSLNFNGGNTASFQVNGGNTLTLPNGVSIPNGQLSVAGTATVEIGNGQSITVNGGSFVTSGTHDSYPQNTALKAKLTVSGAGTWGFTATSGTVSLTGAWFEYIDDSGLNVGGTTNFSIFNGTVFTQLSTNYASMTVMQINTSTVPTSPSDIEWFWGPYDTNFDINDPGDQAQMPPAAAGYTIASSTGCGGNTITFGNWWGNWYDNQTPTPDPNTKISETNCDFVISYASSPISLTSFIGTAYDSNVVLEWTTGGEWDHHGFNVYRSQSFNEGFIKINTDLVRNSFTGMGPGGSYYFKDSTVTNAEVYYYMIEDLSTGGVKTQYGPVFAMPAAGLGAPPAPGASIDIGETDSGADVGNGIGATPIANNGAVDLGHGVHILAQTDSSLRIEIIPAAIQWSASPLDGAYEQTLIPGYTRTLETDTPELLEKVILVEVPSYRTSAEVTNATVVENAIVSAKQIQAVPQYTPDGVGNLNPSHAPDAAVYATNAFSPNTYYSMDTALKEINGVKYIEIIVTPLQYNPATQDVKNLNKLTLDIGLDGSAWGTPTPEADIAEHPAAVPGTLRIRYDSTGMYELSYDDIASAGLDGYFAGISVNELRLYDQGIEVPLEVRSADGIFNSGDELRFFAQHYRSNDSAESEVVLSPWSIGDQQPTALRFEDLSVGPGVLPTSDMFVSEAHAEFEQDLIFLNDRPMGDLHDHFYWVRIAKKKTGVWPYNPEYNDFSLDLPSLLPYESLDARIRVHLRGRHQILKTGDHKLTVQLNENPLVSDTVLWDNFYPTYIDFIVPSSHLVAGANTVRIQTYGDHLPINDTQLVDIDRIEVFYFADLSAESGVKDLYKVDLDNAITVTNFSTNNVTGYDLTDPESYKVFTNPTLTFVADPEPADPDYGEDTYSYTFALSGAVEDVGYRVHLIEDSALKSPLSISSAHGYQNSLKSTENAYDMILIGNGAFLDSAGDLVDERRSEGLSVLEASLDQVYAEFSHGMSSAQAIKDFLNYAKDNWAAKPKYVVLLGDGTLDPRGRLGSNQEHLPPVPLVSGDYIDFGSDAWYASPEDSDIPFLAIGRIPASNQAELDDYIDKIVAFENGSAAPSGDNAKTIGFYSDLSEFHEGFDAKSDQLIDVAKSKNSALLSYHKKLPDYADDNAFMVDLAADFSSAPLVMSFVGHGAMQEWGYDSGFMTTYFESSDADGLSNSEYPLVVGMNCTTAYFYDTNLNNKSLSESLVLNKAGGSIAYWGSTTETVPETQVKLTQVFYDDMSTKLANGQSGSRVGDMILKAQVSLGDKSTAKDTVRSWTFMGDPAMQLPKAAYSPVLYSSEDKELGGGCGLVVPTNHGPSGPGPWVLLMLLCVPLALLLKLKNSEKKIAVRSKYYSL